MTILSNKKISYKGKFLIIFILIGLISFSSLIASLDYKAFAASTFPYASYGFPVPSNPNPILTAEKYTRFKAFWDPYMGPFAVKAGQMLSMDPGMIGGWTLHEGIKSTFFDNCQDKEFDPNTPCMSNNWQVGYGVRIMEQKGRLKEAITAMHPSETLQQIGNAVLAASKSRDPEHAITNPANFPNTTIDEILANADTATNRQLLGILVKDDAIGTYMVGKIIKGYMSLGTGMAASFARWGSFYEPQKVSNSFDAAYKAGTPGGAINGAVYDPASELESIFRETTFYDPNDCVVGSSGYSGAAAPAGGAQNEQNAAIVWNYLTGKGLTAVQVAGIMGNLQRESNFNPSVVNSIGASGIAQWLGGRLQNLKKYAQQQGKTWDDINIQAEYIWVELSGPYKSVLSLIQSSTTVESSTWFFLTRYEIPCVDRSMTPAPGSNCWESQQIRQQYATQWLEKLGGQAATVSQDQCLINQGLGTSPDGFVFPQKTTKTQLAQYSNNSWLKCTFELESQVGYKDNPNQISNPCHHDYLAADIMNATGTPVVAPRPGKITSVKESSKGDNGLMIHLFSDKNLGGDGLWYYFAHSLPGSNTVHEGDVVKAGDQLAVVGTSKDAQGTPPHTHFDMSPSENMFYRNSNGTEGPLISPYKYLQAAYQGLPEQ